MIAISVNKQTNAIANTNLPRISLSFPPPPPPPPPPPSLSLLPPPLFCSPQNAKKSAGSAKSVSELAKHWVSEILLWHNYDVMLWMRSMYLEPFGWRIFKDDYCLLEVGLGEDSDACEGRCVCVCVCVCVCARPLFLFVTCLFPRYRIQRYQQTLIFKKSPTLFQMT